MGCARNFTLNISRLFADFVQRGKGHLFSSIYALAYTSRAGYNVESIPQSKFARLFAHVCSSCKSSFTFLGFLVLMHAECRQERFKRPAAVKKIDYSSYGHK